MRHGQRGQSYAEIAIVLSVVLASLLAMRTWLSRNLQARVRDVTINLLRINEGDTNGQETQRRALEQSNVANTGTSTYETHVHAPDAPDSPTRTRIHDERQGGATQRLVEYHEATNRIGTESFRELVGSAPSDDPTTLTQGETP